MLHKNIDKILSKKTKRHIVKQILYKRGAIAFTCACEAKIREEIRQAITAEGIGKSRSGEKIPRRLTRFARRLTDIKKLNVSIAMITTA